uniref:Ribosomal protein S11 n=1 Tax=Plocamiocolax pulvinatus TaxID=35206 RepID=E5Q3G0_9FLOR|nr:ribosomal protein S11 [Plocamiocolax pulvinata]ADR03243.1 ribosomal protein S11 [Plocamiocolax pulvinata]
MKKLKSIILIILFKPTNFFCIVTDLKGNVLFWTSSGILNSKSTRKFIPSTIVYTLKYIINLLHKYKYLRIKIKGFNKNQKSILKIFKNTFLNILSICDLKSFPHNGCKKRKRKRI